MIPPKTHYSAVNSVTRKFMNLRQQKIVEEIMQSLTVQKKNKTKIKYTMLPSSMMIIFRVQTLIKNG